MAVIGSRNGTGGAIAERWLYGRWLDLLVGCGLGYVVLVPILLGYGYAHRCPDLAGRSRGGVRDADQRAPLRRDRAARLRTQRGPRQVPLLRRVRDARARRAVRGRVPQRLARLGVDHDLPDLEPLALRGSELRARTDVPAPARRRGRSRHEAPLLSVLRALRRARDARDPRSRGRGCRSTLFSVSQTDAGPARNAEADHARDSAGGHALGVPGHVDRATSACLAAVAWRLRSRGSAADQAPAWTLVSTQALWFAVPR